MGSYNPPPAVEALKRIQWLEHRMLKAEEGLKELDEQIGLVITTIDRINAVLQARHDDGR